MFGNFNYGVGSNSGARSGLTRGRIQGSAFNGVNYPNPFFDVAHTYLPTTIKELFKYTRYYFLTQGQINAVTFKMAEYPVTDIFVEHEDKGTKEKWEEMLHDTLRIRSHQIESGLDYFTYGNEFTTISFPFIKALTCAQCKFTERADKLRNNYQFSNYEFRLNCPKCGNNAPAKVTETYLKNPAGIKVIRLSPEDIEITYNELTGVSTYFYQIPGAVRSDITVGKKEIVESVPQIYIQSLRQQKGIVLQQSNLYHMKRATIAFQDRGWGIPLIFPVLKDAFLLQLLRKATESILLEHIIPLRVLFPQAASGTTDPFTTINLVEWKEQMAAEIARWRVDPSYIPILPLPIGTQTVGGDGKALLLFGETQQQLDTIITGMGVPREFIQGGLSWSGSNVSIRMLENAFIGYMGQQRLQLNWIIKSIATYLDWPMVRARFKPFKMADDLQRKMFYLQLNQAQKLSDTTLLSDSDFSQEEEDQIRNKELEKRLQSTKKEQLAMAEIQGEVQLVTMKYQAKAQKAQMQEMGGAQAPGEPGGAEGGMDPNQAAAAQQASQQQAAQAAQQQPAQAAPQAAAAQQGPLQMGLPVPGMLPAGVSTTDANLGGMPQEAQSNLGQGNQLGQGQQGVDLNQLAMMYAQQMANLPPPQRLAALQALQTQSPELAQLVQQYLSQLGVSDKAEKTGPQVKGPAIDMRPLPEQRAPRRAGA
jgi:ssDNA-binding Zn-finger/Zn-ribbon topoisomerase 1